MRVPTGSVDKIATAYYSLPAEERHAITVHQVRAGETVASIAKHYAVSADLIRSANRAARGYRHGHRPQIHGSPPSL